MVKRPRTPQDYRERAAECERLAVQVFNPNTRDAMLYVAKSWRTLADEREQARTELPLFCHLGPRNTRTTVVSQFGFNRRGQMDEFDEDGYGHDPWSEMDLFELGNCCRLKQSVREIAEFLCRDPEEVGAKIDELRKSGEMDRLIETASGVND